MKKQIRLWFLLLFCTILLVACNAGDGEIPTDTDFESESESDVCNKLLPYDLKYTSNGDGTCYVSEILTNPLYTDSFVMTIPATAPNGDKITEVRNPSLECYPLPQLLTADDFSEIDAKLLAKVKTGELEQFYYDRFCAFFIGHSYSALSSEPAKKALLKNYPFAALTDFYILDSATTSINKQVLQETLDLIGYTTKDLIEDEANFRAIIEQSDLENKERIFQEFPNISERLGHGIQGIEFAQGLERIGEGAFANLTNLRTVVFPNSLTHIEAYAFGDCTNLENILLPDGVRCIGAGAFANCTKLKNIHIPDSVTSMGGGMFTNCVALTEVIIPEETVLTSSLDFFSGCSELSNVSLPNTLISIDSRMFLNCSKLSNLTVPSGVTRIGGSAFKGCTSLASISFPQALVQIGSDAFKDCNQIIEEENGIFYVGQWAIGDASDLETVLLRDGTVGIAEYAFAADNIGGNIIEKVYFPDSLQYVNGGAFHWCLSLNQVHISKLEQWLTIDFWNDANPLYYAKKLYIAGELVSEYNIPDGSTEIKRNSFSGSSVTKITIPGSLKLIEEGAFFECINLSIVYYEGSEAEWNKIGIYDNNDPLLTGARYYYSENNPTEAGNYWRYVNGVPTVW